MLLEAVYALGTAMLMLVRWIPDLPRERSVVYFFRLKGGTQAVGPSINAVMKLCASTGFDPNAKHPPAGESAMLTQDGGHRAGQRGPSALLWPTPTPHFTSSPPIRCSPVVLF